MGLNPAVPSYTEGVVGQPRSFLPSQTQTQNDVTVSRLIYRGLFKYDIFGTLIPDLAETWSISEGGLVYTVKLKDDQYWSNGQKISADDLIYTSFKVPSLAGVATDRVDDLTVRYTLPNKYSPFLSLLTVGVMPENAEEEQDALSPVSSGPFRVIKVERNGPLTKQVTLVHEDIKQPIRKLSFRYYANEDELLTSSKLGEIDGFISSQEHEIDNFENYTYPLQGVYFAMFFNLREEKLQDLELRQALADALPVKALITERGISVQGPISRSAFTDRSLEIPVEEESEEEEVVVATDYSDITLRITVPEIKIHKKLADEIEDIWEDKLKMDVQIVEVDPEKIVEENIKTRDFEVLFYGQEVGRDPDRYINWHSTQKDHPGLNLSGFEQVRADRALEEGRNEPDSNARTVHYNEFQKVVDEEVPAIFLYHPFTKHYVTQFIEGIGEKYTFTVGDRFLDFDNWKRVKTN